jgi:hypothetical protein
MQLIECLAESDVFRGLSPRHLDLIASFSRVRYVKAESFIFREGELANTFYILC